MAEHQEKTGRPFSILVGLLLKRTDRLPCEVDEKAHAACKGFPYYGEHEGKRYCVLHHPSDDKTAQFEGALLDKLGRGDYDFSGVVFPPAVSNLENRRLNGDDADFSTAEFRGNAIFRNTTFGGTARFNHTIFKQDVSFAEATFSSAASFRNATFGRYASFINATFEKEVDFLAATFNGTVHFRETTFGNLVRFDGAIIRDEVLFVGNAQKRRYLFTPESIVSFAYATIERPRRVFFQAVLLRPSWFIYVDVRELSFNFDRIKWYGVPHLGTGKIEDEIKALQRREVPSPHQLLARVYRELSINAETNHDFPTAGSFHYGSMESSRKRSLSTRFKPVLFLYWLLSGYGNRPRRVLVAFLLTWVAFAGLYVWRGSASGDECSFAPLNVGEALAYSLGAMTLQAQDSVSCLNGWPFVLVYLEGAFGLLLIALLALALRRGFMR